MKPATAPSDPALGPGPSALEPLGSPADLQALLSRRPDLWRGRASRGALPAGLPSGFEALDSELSWGGWPPGGLIELLESRPGTGLGLVLPALVRLGTACRWLLLVDPPWLPFAPALAARGLALERLVVVEAGERTAWAAEQALRSRACAAVLLWRARWEGAALRRLQLAAETAAVPAFLFREAAAMGGHSPAPLRLTVAPEGTGWRVEVLKQRGGRAGAMVVIRAEGRGPRAEVEGLPSSPTRDARIRAL
jgi:hypothetical protein